MSECNVVEISISSIERATGTVKPDIRTLRAGKNLMEHLLREDVDFRLRPSLAFLFFGTAAGRLIGASRSLDPSLPCSARESPGHTGRIAHVQSTAAQRRRRRDRAQEIVPPMLIPIPEIHATQSVAFRPHVSHRPVVLRADRHAGRAGIDRVSQVCCSLPQLFARVGVKGVKISIRRTDDYSAAEQQRRGIQECPRAFRVLSRKHPGKVPAFSQRNYPPGRVEVEAHTPPTAAHPDVNLVADGRSARNLAEGLDRLPVGRALARVDPPKSVRIADVRSSGLQGVDVPVRRTDVERSSVLAERRRGIYRPDLILLRVRIRPHGIGVAEFESVDSSTSASNVNRSAVRTHGRRGEVEAPQVRGDYFQSVGRDIPALGCALLIGYVCESDGNIHAVIGMDDPYAAQPDPPSAVPALVDADERIVRADTQRILCIRNIGLRGGGRWNPYVERVSALALKLHRPESRDLAARAGRNRRRLAIPGALVARMGPLSPPAGIGRVLKDVARAAPRQPLGLRNAAGGLQGVNLTVSGRHVRHLADVSHVRHRRRRGDPPLYPVVPVVREPPLRYAALVLPGGTRVILCGNPAHHADEPRARLERESLTGHQIRDLDGFQRTILSDTRKHNIVFTAHCRRGKYGTHVLLQPHGIGHHNSPGAFALGTVRETNHHVLILAHHERLARQRYPRTARVLVHRKTLGRCRRAVVIPDFHHVLSILAVHVRKFGMRHERWEPDVHIVGYHPVDLFRERESPARRMGLRWVGGLHTQEIAVVSIQPQLQLRHSLSPIRTGEAEVRIAAIIIVVNRLDTLFRIRPDPDRHRLAARQRVVVRLSRPLRVVPVHWPDRLSKRSLPCDGTCQHREHDVRCESVSHGMLSLSSGACTPYWYNLSALDGCSNG